MTKELGEINYDNEAKLIATQLASNLIPEIDLIINNEDSLDNVELEALFIARKIQDLVKSGKVQYKDIGILYRSINKKASKILNIFSQEGIPVLFEGTSEQVDTIEIDLFLNLLKLIDNNKQDIPLVSVLETPIFNFNSEDLANIRIAYPDLSYFFQAVENYRDNNNDELSKKLNSFYQKLYKWRYWSKHLEIDEFLWQVLLDSGLYNYFGNLNNGKQRKQNLRLLIEKAQNYKETSLKGITSFLQYIAQLRKNEESLSILGTSADTENVVHLMSIHKSKGLEFKVVFLGGLNNQFNRDKSKIQYHKKYGFGFKLPVIKNDIFSEKDNLLNKAIKQIHYHEELSEEIRLLYVAMTRAQERLFLVATFNHEAIEKRVENWKINITPTNLKKDKNAIDWIMKTIYQDESFVIKDDNHFETSNWKIKIIPGDVLLKNYEELIDEKIIEDEKYLKLKDKIFKQLNLPPKEIVNRKPLKVSVSRMKRHSIKEEEPIELISLNQEKKKISGKEIGTVTHLILQKVDLNKLEESNNLKETLVKEIDELISKEFVSKEIAELIDYDNIANFFKSELGKRYLKSFKNDPNNVLKEIPFLFDINKKNELNMDVNRPIELTGIIDVCFLEDNRWIVIDYKTDHLNSEQQFKQRLEEYSTQINLYSSALEKLTGFPVKEKHVYFLNENRDVLI